VDLGFVEGDLPEDLHESGDRDEVIEEMWLA
jgi:hypothetical protein